LLSYYLRLTNLHLEMNISVYILKLPA